MEGTRRNLSTRMFWVSPLMRAGIHSTDRKLYSQNIREWMQCGDDRNVFADCMIPENKRFYVLDDVRIQKV